MILSEDEKILSEDEFYIFFLYTREDFCYLRPPQVGIFTKRVMPSQEGNPLKGFICCQSRR